MNLVPPVTVLEFRFIRTVLETLHVPRGVLLSFWTGRCWDTRFWGQDPGSENVYFSTKVFCAGSISWNCTQSKNYWITQPQKIWRKLHVPFLKKSGKSRKTDFVGMALFRDPRLVAPPSRSLVSCWKDPGRWEQWRWNGVDIYFGYPKIEKYYFAYFFICCSREVWELNLKFLWMGNLCNSFFPLRILSQPRHMAQYGPPGRPNLHTYSNRTMKDGEHLWKVHWLKLLPHFSLFGTLLSKWELSQNYQF